MMNTLFDPKKNVKPAKPKQIVDSFEIFKDTPKAIKQEAKNTLTDAAGDFWNQLLGVNKKTSLQKNGDLTPGQSINFKDAGKSQESKANNSAAMNYSEEIMRAGEAAVQRENAELRQTIQQLLAELQKVAATTKDTGIAAKVTEAVGTGRVTKQGKYYTAFFQHIFGILQDARKKASGGEMWKNTVKGKGKKGIHKLMKSNMQVAMSGERSAATSSG